MKPNRFYGNLKDQPTEAFALALLFKIKSLAVRYTTHAHVGFGIARWTIGVPSVHVQIYKLSIYFRLEKQ